MEVYKPKGTMDLGAFEQGRYSFRMVTGEEYGDGSTTAEETSAGEEQQCQTKPTEESTSSPGQQEWRQGEGTDGCYTNAHSLSCKRALYHPSNNESANRASNRLPLLERNSATYDHDTMSLRNGTVEVEHHVPSAMNNRSKGVIGGEVPVETDDGPVSVSVNSTQNDDQMALQIQAVWAQAPTGFWEQHDRNAVQLKDLSHRAEVTNSSPTSEQGAQLAAVHSDEIDKVMHRTKDSARAECNSEPLPANGVDGDTQKQISDVLVTEGQKQDQEESDCCLAKPGGVTVAAGAVASHVASDSVSLTVEPRAVIEEEVHSDESVREDAAEAVIAMTEDNSRQSEEAESVEGSQLADCDVVLASEKPRNTCKIQKEFSPLSLESVEYLRCISALDMSAYYSSPSTAPDLEADALALPIVNLKGLLFENSLNIDNDLFSTDVLREQYGRRSVDVLHQKPWSVGWKISRNTIEKLRLNQYLQYSKQAHLHPRTDPVLLPSSSHKRSPRSRAKEGGKASIPGGFHLPDGTVTSLLPSSCRQRSAPELMTLLSSLMRQSSSPEKAFGAKRKGKSSGKGKGKKRLRTQRELFVNGEERREMDVSCEESLRTKKMGGESSLHRAGLSSSGSAVPSPTSPAFHSDQKQRHVDSMYQSSDVPDVYFCANVSTDGWKPQLEELQKLPQWMLWDNPDNFLQLLRQNVDGMTSPQIYLKVPGVWTGGHEENCRFASVNCNHGPDPSEWGAVEGKYVGKLRKLAWEHFGIDIFREEGAWFPDIEFCRLHDIPILTGRQEAGDVMILKGGSVHWVRALGYSVHSSWNFGPVCHEQLKDALMRYDLNVALHLPRMSVVPMQTLCIDLASWIVKEMGLETNRRASRALSHTGSRGMASDSMSPSSLAVGSASLLPGTSPARGEFSSSRHKISQKLLELLRNRMVDIVEHDNVKQDRIKDFLRVKPQKEPEGAVMVFCENEACKRELVQSYVYCFTCEAEKNSAGKVKLSLPTYGDSTLEGHVAKPVSVMCIHCGVEHIASQREKAAVAEGQSHRRSNEQEGERRSSGQKGATGCEKKRRGRPPKASRTPAISPRHHFAVYSKLEKGTLQRLCEQIAQLADYAFL